MAGEELWAHPEPSSVGGSLLVRCGGEKAVHDFIYGLYDRILEDKNVAPLLLRSQQAQSLPVYLKLLKDRTVEYLEVVWGGDHYDGQDLFKSHAQLHISAAAYDRCIKMAGQQLKAQGMAAREKKEIMEQMEIMKVPICDADGAFHAFVHKKQKEIEARLVEQDDAVDLHGMGFTTSAATVKRWAVEKQQKEDRSAKLAAMKVARKEAAKEAAKEASNPKPEKEKQEDLSTSGSTVASVSDQKGPKKVKEGDKKGASPKTKKSAVQAKAKEVPAVRAEKTVETLKEKPQEKETEKKDDEPWLNWPELPEEDGTGFVPQSTPTPLFTFIRATTC